ncbi:MAG: hypothetical protein LBS74_00445 [Oscillospiraceae bacterium]|jgi:hypothetical protein|nr:hypothetical protein [Oscillospiraceae bacterium]
MKDKFEKEPKKDAGSQQNLFNNVLCESSLTHGFKYDDVFLFTKKFLKNRSYMLTTEGKKTIEALPDDLEENNFVKISESTFVNIRHIKSFPSRFVKITNGKLIYLNYEMSNAVKKAYAAFIMKNK